MREGFKTAAHTSRWGFPALLLATCIASALAAACSDSEAPSRTNAKPTPGNTEDAAGNANDGDSNVETRQAPELSPDAKSLIDEIGHALAHGYETLHVIILLDMRGEIMPCGCSDGVRGGLIKFASLAKQLKGRLDEDGQPTAFLSLGGNHFRTIEEDRFGPFADYYNRRMVYVDRAIESLGPTLKLVKAEEREFLENVPEFQIREQLNATINLSSGTAVNLQAADSDLDTAPDAEWTIIFGPRSETADSTAGNEAGMVFGGRVSPGARGRVAVLPRPEFGGRDLAHLTLYIPKGESSATGEDGRKTVRSLGEVNAYRSIAAKSGDRAALLESVRKRWEELNDHRPVLYEYERIVVKLDTEDDPEQLDMYFKFQSDESAQLGGIDDLGRGDEYVRSCEPCHADVVADFKAQDPHFHAMETLRREGKHNDRFCATCHVTPKYERGDDARGFKLYAGVLCESCHVNAQSHAARPSVIKPFAVSAGTCKTCHTKTQHPDFDFNKHATHVCCNIGKEEK